MFLNIFFEKRNQKKKANKDFFVFLPTNIEVTNTYTFTIINSFIF